MTARTEYPGFQDENLKAFQRLLGELHTRESHYIDEYSAFVADEMLWKYNQNIRIALSTSCGPKPGESLKTYSERRCEVPGKRIRERKIQSFEAELESAINVQDKPKIAEVLKDLADLSSPLPPELMRGLARLIAPDSFGCKMGPKPKNKPSLAKEKRCLFSAYNFLCWQGKAARWVFNAEKKEFFVKEGTALLNGRGEFFPQWVHPDLKMNRGDDVPKREAIKAFICAFFKVSVREFDDIRAQGNNDILLFYDTLIEKGFFPPNFISGLLADLYHCSHAKLRKKRNSKTDKLTP